VDLGAAGPKYSGEPLVILRVSGSAATPVPLPDDSLFPQTTMINLGALGDSFISAQREIQFSSTLGNAGAAQYFIDGKPLDVTRTDIRAALNAIEEWTIINLTQEHHLFHIHQLSFQVTQRNGVPVPFTGYDDTVDIPGLNVDLSANSVTIRMSFDRLNILGRFYYHCHVMRHEDNGMMAVMEVYDPNAAPTTIPPLVGSPAPALLAPAALLLAALMALLAL
jgi:suppressor of ftsI